VLVKDEQQVFAPITARRRRNDPVMAMLQSQPAFRDRPGREWQQGLGQNPQALTAIAAQPDMSLIAQSDSGREAVELFRLHRPDITLMDLQMPDLNGIQAIEKQDASNHQRVAQQGGARAPVKAILRSCRSRSRVLESSGGTSAALGSSLRQRLPQTL
jgi:Response regulator receiver domain